MKSAESLPAKWAQAMAEVTGCHYDARAGRALAFGLTSAEHFRISYNYRVGNELHFGECFSETARMQGSLFPIRYDCNSPHLSDTGSLIPRRRTLLAIGVAGSIALSLMWLSVLRGC